MLSLIIRKEIREQIGSFKFAITFGICSLLILLAFVVGAINFNSSMIQYDAAVSENKTQMQTNTSWISVQHNVHKPPMPLSVLVSGISNDVGRSVRMSSGELRATNSRFNEEPMLAIFRFMDLEFIFGTILSLFAVLFAFDSVNGERERGTLKLAFSNAVPKATFILGKLLGTIAALLLPLLIPVLIGILFLPLFGVHLTSDELLRLVMILGVGFLFVTAFLILSVMVSAMTRRSSASFVILLVLWIGVVLIVPRVAVLVSAQFVDVPSSDLIDKQKRDYAAALDKEDQASMASFSPTPGASIQEVIQELGKVRAEKSQIRIAKVDEFNERLNEDLENRQRNRERVALALARISPLTPMSVTMTELAGTSIYMKDRFMDQASAYNTTYSAFTNSKLDGIGIDLGGGRRAVVSTTSLSSVRSSGPARSGAGFVVGGSTSSSQTRQPIDISELPEFTYADASTSEVMPQILLDLALLISFCALFFTGAFFAFLRYDVR